MEQETQDVCNDISAEQSPPRAEHEPTDCPVPSAPQREGQAHEMMGEQGSARSTEMPKEGLPQGSAVGQTDSTPPVHAGAPPVQQAPPLPDPWTAMQAVQRQRDAAWAQQYERWEQHAVGAVIEQLRALDPALTDFAALRAQPNVAQFDALVDRGYTLTDAYKLTQFEALLEKSAQAARQQALRSVASRAHLRPTQGGVCADPVAIPSETVEAYHRLLPDWSMEQIRQSYRKHGR